MYISIIMQKSVNINFIMDLSCPWSYIGKRRMQRAISARPNGLFTITIFPFITNDNIAPDGIGRKEFCAKKYGGNWDLTAKQLHKLGQNDMINFDFDSIERQPNIMLAFSMVKWAGALDNNGFFGLEMAEMVMDAFFCRGQDIGNAPTCQTIMNQFCTRNKMKPVDVFQPFSQWSSLITMNHRFVQMHNIKEAPVFNINDIALLHGCPTINAFLPIFDIVFNGG